MAYSSGDPNAFFSIGMQSAKGTPQVAPAKLRYMKYLAGANVAGDIEAVDLREGGDGLDFGYTYKKAQKAVGQVVINLRPEIAGQLFQMLPGGATWDGGSAPAIHTFNTGHASFPWFTGLIQHPGSTLPQMISDAIFTGFTLEGQAGEPWKVTLPFVALVHGASYAAVTPTLYTEEPFLFHYSPTYVLDGAGDSKITAFKIEQGLGIEELQTQAVTLDDIAVQNRDTTVEITRIYTDATLWKKIYMGAGVQPTTSVATGAFRADSLYGAAGTLRSLSLEARLLSYRGDVLTELNPDGETVKETLSSKALKGATHAFFAVLKNTHASAYSG
jgi:hypothetical protein